MAVTLVCSTERRKIGSRLWMTSEETSMNMLTKPRAHTPRGIDSAFFIRGGQYSISRKVLCDWRALHRGFLSEASHGCPFFGADSAEAYGGFFHGTAEHMHLDFPGPDGSRYRRRAGHGTTLRTWWAGYLYLPERNRNQGCWSRDGIRRFRR